MHVGFVIALLWLLTVGIRRMTAPDAAAGETVTEVTFVGDGTPQDRGGGEDAPAPAEATPLPPTEEPPAPAATAVAPQTQPPPAVTIDPPEPPAEAPAAQTQPLQVTEVATTDNRFTLPPPRPVAVPVPTLATPVVAARSRDIAVVEPVLPPQTRPLPVREIAAPDLARPVAEVEIREIPAPLPTLRPVPAPAVSAAPAIVSVDAPAVAVRQLPMPAARPVTIPATPSASTRVLPAAAAPVDGGQATQNPARAATSRTGAVGAGPAAPRPGAAATPRAGDDWADAASARSGSARSGGPPGLFDADGRPRIAGGGRVGGGLPPGTVTEDFEKIDRMGTWLKRPPTDYEPTSFDRFWVPSETLLQEWVRRSIRTVMIPIPGTTKQLRCDVALLALGGGCGISDANLQDVEAGARPPPDVPFKPELQEDPEALL